MDQILFARQPIVNGSKSIVGYELLFRSNAPISSIDGNLATSQVLLNAFTEGEIDAVVADGRAFVNFTDRLLISPPPFGKEKLVVEILENVELTPEVREAIKRLHRDGFSMALDDYVPGTIYDELLPYIEIVKLEIPAIPPEQLEDTIRTLKRHRVTLLAEKIETHEDFHRCKSLGCDLFQGYFFSKPELVKGRKMPQNRVAIMELISKVNQPTMSVHDITQIITRDPSLSVKLLQLVNSPAFRRPDKVGSIHMAVMILGLGRIKSWATLLALSNIDDKPVALITLALIRAKVCELLAEKIEPNAREVYFTVGLFSCLEAFFDQPFSEILEKLPLDERVCDALIRFKGRPGLALNTALQYERCKLDSIHWGILEKMKVSQKMVGDIYKESIAWAKESTLY
ncbi:diguanylate phosphodiesterase [Hahella sp. CCB-MM4]|uniref:EAL and HDOD domain-containing protein n=1 Tax=Hahella sp. (strain CCB-MM4) TaxID=1926491 RepID=UPI000B9B3737|nr:HDOD domain-containing protein [Hahella sp. CCB-MM4]OZG73831.1 diguanylate phosphodiesterase [Hahella sp. CCB-MM4]